MHYVLMVTGVIFTIMSPFLSGWEVVIVAIIAPFAFSFGWEMWRASLNQGSLIGEITYPSHDIKFDKNPSIKLLELDGKEINSKLTRKDNKFIFTKVNPGQYVIDVEGEFLQCTQKTVNVFPSRDSDIGIIPCGINQNKFWKIHSLGGQMQDIMTSTDGTTWITGFTTEKKSHHNNYVVFRLLANADKWTKVIIPEIHGAERGTFIYQFSTGEICLGTNGKGAIISNNNGLSWQKLELLSSVNSIRYITELPNKTWLIIGSRLIARSRTYPEKEARTVLLTSSDRGINWNILSERNDDINKFIRHSSGRMLIGTEALDGKGGIYYSDDGGINWNKSQMENGNWRGIEDIIELENGDLLSGSMDGKMWLGTNLKEGEFIKGGRINISKDAGETWKILAGETSWGSIKSILKIDDSILLSSQGSNLIWSIDNGISWFHFGTNFGSINNIIESGDKLMMATSTGVGEIPKNRIIVNYINNPNNA